MADRIVENLGEVERDLRRLERRFPSVRADIDAARRLLAAGTNLLQKVRLQGFGDQKIYKGRAINSDVNRGKSSGYRLIWAEEAEIITLIYIYDKNTAERQVINEIRQRLND